MSTFVRIQKILPQRLLTEVAGMLAEVRWEPFKNFLIKWFQQSYEIDLSEAKVKDPLAYKNFNQFFTRPLAEGTRPIHPDPNALVCPADGFISEIGPMQRGSLIQAKDVLYTATELLADNILAAKMESGSFATIYLSPSDYHRVHIPFAGTLLGLTYVPGKLFSVNDVTARSLDGLFTRNERLVAQIQTDSFTYALVMVGAMIVGGMGTAFTGRIKRRTHLVEFKSGIGKSLVKGQEFGRFHLGSTAIFVLPKEAGVQFDPAAVKGKKVKVGERLGLLKAVGD